MHEFVSVSSKKFNRFKLNLSRFQSQKNNIYELVHEVLNLLENLCGDEESLSPLVNESQIIFQIVSVVALTIKFHMMANDNYTDFGEDITERGAIFVHGTIFKSGAQFIRRIPLMMPYFLNLTKIQINNLDIVAKIMEILTATSGFSLHIYKDKNYGFKLKDTYKTIFIFTIEVFGKQELIETLLKTNPHEVAELVANLLSELLLTEIEQLAELERVTSLIHDLTLKLFKNNIQCDYVVFTNFLKFWSKLSKISKHSKALSGYQVPVRNMVKYSVEYQYQLVLSLNYESAEDSFEILQKIGRSIYNAYHLDIQRFYEICLLTLQKLREMPPGAPASSLQESENMDVNTIYFFSIYLTLTENLSPKLLDKSQTMSYDSSLTQGHAQLTSQVLDFIWNEMCRLKDTKSPAKDVLRVFFVKVLHSLLIEWILNTKWNFEDWLEKICECVNDGENEDKKTKIVSFIIHLLSSKDIVNQTSFKYFTEFLSSLCHISRIDKNQNGSGFLFLLGSTVFDITRLGTLYFSHFEDLNYSMKVDVQLCRLYYERLAKITCTIDNSKSSLIFSLFALH